ncbi:gamma-glutamyl-gamma-aminobutyrate hydrolase family protein [Vibrio breoganii]|uniref:gamma-glutamyl-gamma-aminobutyrate hydrolase family protein n=1 Tax=Vibrio breoganii TaxID=553239 RepID=UPI000303F531|nr:gamma-glutamyl-gamma-aminobutyrate hydrolase family protein [Vibrio breoganii]OED84791.1 gamma-glutamyl-gamma-aminobutyrate hydrolase [Vibrio breoganii ZF-55]
MSDSRKPIIGVVSCSKSLGGYQIQAVNEFYLDAVTDFGGLPIVISPRSTSDDLKAMLDVCDGFLFPGSHSNVAPHRYGAEHVELKTDEARDEISISLLRHAIDRDIPCLGICRGFQEMNVALGGTLTPAVHESGYNDHRESQTDDFSEKYAPSHPVLVQENSKFERWLSQYNWQNTQSFDVNTLHNQGVKTLAPTLMVEATAPDGLIEAFSLPDQRFFVGVQWHPEWQATSNQFSKILFKEFMMEASNS